MQECQSQNHMEHHYKSEFQLQNLNVQLNLDESTSNWLDNYQNFFIYNLLIILSPILSCLSSSYSQLGRKFRYEAFLRLKQTLLASY